MHHEAKEFAALHRGRLKRQALSHSTPRLCCVPGCDQQEDIRSDDEHFVCPRHRARGPLEVRRIQ